jgi:hypothetical protein
MTHTLGTDPVPVEGKVFRHQFKAKHGFRLTPTISNDNDIPLYEPRIVISVPEEVSAKEQPRLWQINIGQGYRQFFAEGFGPILRGVSRGPNESIYLIFPRPGQYSVKYSVSGIALDNITINVSGWFLLELTE